MIHSAGAVVTHQGASQRSAAVTVLIPAALFAAVLAYVSLGVTMDHLQPMDNLHHRVIDEYVIFADLRDMYDALMRGAWAEFLNIRLKAYGSVYVLGSFLISLPFLAINSIDAAVYSLRSMSLLLGAGAIGMLSLWAWRATGQITAGLFVGLAAMSCTGFWIIASWIHPDVLMALFVLVATLYAGGREGPMRFRQIAVCALLYALALASKFQAAIYMAGVVVAIALNTLGEHPAQVRRLVINLASFGALLAVFYVLLNPFFFIPGGASSYFDQLLSTMASNATGHFMFVKIPLSEKIASLEYFYGSIVGYGALVAVAALALTHLRPGPVRITAISLLAMSATSFAYLLITLNKAGVFAYYYYLSYLALLPVAAVSISSGIVNRRLAAFLLFLIPIIMLVASSGIKASLLAKDLADSTRFRAGSEPLERALRPIVDARTTIVISPYTPLRGTAIGLDYRRLRIIWGYLDNHYAQLGDLLVLRKNDVYFERERPPADDIAARQYNVAREYVEQIRSGNDADFRPCGETDRVYIFCRRPPR